MTRTIFSAALIALALTCAAQAAPKQVVVSYADLNLASPADQATLASRVHTAAVQVCGPVVIGADNRPSVQTEAKMDNKACIARISETAMAHIDAAQVASRAAAKKVASN